MWKFVFFVLFMFSVQSLFATTALVVSPKSCDYKKESCHYKNIQTNLVNLSVENYEIKIPKGSIIRIKQGNLKVLSGFVMVRCLQLCSVSTLAQTEVELEGVAIFSSEQNKNQVIALEGALSLGLTNGEQVHLLPGMTQENFRQNSVNFQSEFPRVIQKDELNSFLLSLTKKVNKYMESYLKSVKETTHFLAKVTNDNRARLVADEKERMRILRERKSRYNSESHRLRQIFRNKLKHSF